MKKAENFLLGAGSHTAKFSKDSAIDSIEKEKSLQADASRFVRGISIASTQRLILYESLVTLLKRQRLKKDINKQKCFKSEK